MKIGPRTRIAVLALVGLVVALVLGLTTHAIARDTFAPATVELEAGEPLAPPEAREDRADDESAKPRRTKEKRDRGRDHGTTTEQTTTTPPTTTDDDDGGDDDGSGRGRGRGRGGDDSGSGSDDSGSGSDDSGSGSDDSGSGSDDSGSGSDDSGSDDFDD